MKSQLDGFDRLMIELDVTKASREIADSIGQTLARLVGWDYVNNSFRLVNVDNAGNLKMSLGPTQSNTGATTAVSVGTTATKILAENTNRKLLAIYNNGSATVYYTLGTSPAVATSFPLVAGGLFATDQYYGDLYGIVASGTCEVRVLDLY